MGRKTKTLLVMLCMITTIIVAMALPAVAGERYPYIKATGTDGHFEGEWAGTQSVLLECEHFRGRYWTRRPSDGWLYLAKLADDPVEAGQVFNFERNVQVLTPGDPHGAHWERGKWHLVCAARRSAYSWLEARPGGFYFGSLRFTDNQSGILNAPEQLWRIRVIRDEGAYQVIRLSSMTKNGAAASGWGEAIPHEWVN